MKVNPCIWQHASETRRTLSYLLLQEWTLRFQVPNEDRHLRHFRKQLKSRPSLDSKLLCALKGVGIMGAFTILCALSCSK